MTISNQVVLDARIVFICRGSVLRKTWGEQNLEFKIRNMELLNELGSSAKGLQLKMNAVTINPG